MKARRLWRRAGALAGGLSIGFVCVIGLQRLEASTYVQQWLGSETAPTRRRLQAEGTGLRPLKCFQGYTQIQGGAHWTQGAVLRNASLPSDGAHLKATAPRPRVPRATGCASLALPRQWFIGKVALACASPACARRTYRLFDSQ